MEYTKPTARNLGEMLPTAEGLCAVFGYSAETLPPPSCNTGGNAQGDVCYTSGSSATNSGHACNAGSHPAYLGCVSGTDPGIGNCHTGSFA